VPLWQTRSNTLSGATGVGPLGGLAWNEKSVWSLARIFGLIASGLGMWTHIQGACTLPLKKNSIGLF